MSLKELKVIMFMSPYCVWCNRMIDILSNEKQLGNLKVVNINQADATDILNEYKIRFSGTPAFISRKYNTRAEGYKSTVSQLIQALTPNPVIPPIPPLLPNKSTVVYIDATCPVCYEEITKLTVEPCGHGFCIECSKKLKKCPKCNST